MRVGVPKEIKDHEDRVGLVPSSVAELVRHGHEVMVEAGAGLGAGLEDDAIRRRRRAHRRRRPTEIFRDAEMIVKVKEPLAPERKKLRPGQVLFTYLHLAPDPEQTQELLQERRHRHRLRDRDLADRRAAAADADVGDRRPPRAAGRRALPRDARRAAAACCWAACRACRRPRSWCWAAACRARMPRPSRSAWAPTSPWSTARPRCCAASPCSSPGARTIFSTHDALVQVVRRADLLIGAVLVPGAAAPKLVTRDMVKTMKTGSVLVDIAIDQGGCCETSQADHPFRSDLCRRRRDALLRHQHAGRGGAHLDLRAQQRDPAVRAGAGRQGLAAGDRRGSAPAQRAQRPCRQAHLQAGRRSAGPRLTQRRNSWPRSRPLRTARAQAAFPAPTT